MQSLCDGGGRGSGGAGVRRVNGRKLDGKGRLGEERGGNEAKRQSELARRLNIDGAGLYYF